MGKRKQEIKKETPNSINEGTAYTGIVTLKIEKKNKILKTLNIKNTGTLRFFQGIALAIQNVGSNVLKGSFLPAYLDVGNGTGSFSVSSTTLHNSLLRNNRVELTPLQPKLNDSSEPTGYISRFIGVIPYNLVSTVSLTELGIFADKQGDTLLAAIPFDEPIQLEQGMNLIVEWNMNFENKGEDTNG